MSFPAAMSVKPAREWVCGVEEEVRLRRPPSSGVHEDGPPGGGALHLLGTTEHWIGYCRLKRFSRNLEPEGSMEQIHLSVRPGDGGSTQMSIIL